MEPLLIESTIHQDLQYLYALDGKGIKPGLKRVLLFLDRIGNPQKKIRTIHVAGTNGKGSTCAIIASILQAAGYKVGLYTSPHLIRFNERIRVDNEKISDEEIVSFLHNHRPLIDEIDTTFFETTTAIAFDHFRRRKVDIAIIETGLGGRFDATNVVTPLLSVITPIGKDHEEFLGNTLAKITREKAGIIKTGVPCLAARQRPGVKQILKNYARDKSSVFHYAPDLCRVSGVDRQIDGQEVNIKCDGLRLNGVTLPLIGDHQVSNLQTAVSVVRLIPGFRIPPETIQKGVKAT
ncbi:MAG: bifunctional folylpolyglutamate synthase/dihydrofolate synthase, partial [Candidatus Marinimicrobia bacterium]|nr:bifunctional folylpolyglutamate synthase/dihydrofolate synthase [Candidatus Neomarinimicrobiota bacterium]